MIAFAYYQHKMRKLRHWNGFHFLNQACKAPLRGKIIPVKSQNFQCYAQVIKKFTHLKPEVIYYGFLHS